MGGILIYTYVSVGPSSAAANSGTVDVKMKEVRRSPSGKFVMSYTMLLICVNKFFGLCWAKAGRGSWL
jgi:hypothetical protein